ncbi:MAG: hypothetical protein DMG12_13260 [Acidobacteria bacterium]|nr:MAG: hypothetical protein DMG12_13260 [Acidobacteriota bacterium]
MLGICRNLGRPGDGDEAAAHRFFGLLERCGKQAARQALPGPFQSKSSCLPLLPADSTLCFGTRVASCVSEMHYDVIYLIVFLALLLVGGILLIVDAAVRLLRRR